MSIGTDPSRTARLLPGSAIGTATGPAIGPENVPAPTGPSTVATTTRRAQGGTNRQHPPAREVAAMSVRYSLAYRLGITPWDRAGAGQDDAFRRLMDREEDEHGQPFGRALDLGCGTGEYTRELERRGWEVKGVDNIRLAVDIAIRRGGTESRYVIGDVTSLKGCGVGNNFSFYLDVGCFNSLSEEQRHALGEGVTLLAHPGA